MEETYSIQRLLLLRKVTRALAESLRNQLKDYVAALAPLIRPKVLLGDFVTGSTKESPNFADKSFQELMTVYQTVAGTKPFTIPREVKPPLEVAVTPLELHPLEYLHHAQTGTTTKRVQVTSPLRWVLSYPGYGIAGLRVALAERNPSAELLQRYAVHHSLLSYVIQKQPGFSRVLAALRFSLNSGTIPELGNLPITFIAAPVSTVLPPDDVIVENTEISGSSAFEEVVNVGDLATMKDPLREQIFTVVRDISPGLLPE